jgi:diguanylate cyclase (GGDEF)-like protein
VDRTLLPEIFSLTVFIAGFLPMGRRVGPQANLWFLGWALLLGQDVALLFAGPTATPNLIANLLANWAIHLCALVFLVVTANVPTKRMNGWLALEFSVPVMSQATLSVLNVRSPVAQVLCCILYVVPIGHLLVRRRTHNRPMLNVAAVFGLCGLLLIPVALDYPNSVSNWSLTLLLLCAAYFYYVSAEQFSRGVIAALVGLVGWGLSYPAMMWFGHLLPAVPVDRVILSIPRYFVVAGIMLTMLQEHVERTERMAMHDPLTDLPNRRLFEQRLIATMEEARINRTTVACLVIDVDNFKTINDTLGHSAGDQLLRALAVRLSWHMSPRDILARTGGDEFTALLAGVNDEHHLRFIASAMMSAGSVPIVIDGKSVDVHISIGIALSPDHADDIDSLRRAADAAMYSAKRRGGAMLAFADEG